MKSNLFSRTLCAILFLIMLFSAVSTINFATSDYEYASPSAPLSTNVYADEFLNDYVGIDDLLQVEADFLRLQSGFLISYNSAIPSNVIATEYNDGILKVTATEYSYTAVNGVDVVWRPTAVILHGNQTDFSKGTNVLVIPVASAKEGESISVKYEASFSISAKTVNELLNLGYDSAPRLKAEIKEKTEEYQSAYNEYVICSQQYNEYLSALALYNEYLAKKRIYDAENAEYLAYLEREAAYVAARAEYDVYIEARRQYEIDLKLYTEYLAYAETHAALIEAYEKYQEKIDTVTAQLEIIKITKTPVTSLSRTVYAAITGDTVTSVIDRKGDIVTMFGVDPAVVDLADVSTRNLRVLLKDFFDIHNSPDRYSYYITNYEAFRDNFVNLLRALDNLYQVSGVRGAMKLKDKHEKYLILVAQLYYVANALSDEPIISYNGKYYFDKNYRIGMAYPENERYTPFDALEGEHFIEDTNKAEPISGGYPTEQEKPEYTRVDEPKMPTPVKMPIAPEEVSEPVAPEVVDEPLVVHHPGKAPKEYVPPSECVALVEAYDRGDLKRREEYVGEDVLLNPTIIVDKVFVGAKSVTVNYYNSEFDSEEPQKLLYSITVDCGSAIDYRGPVPQKLEDSDNIYLHIGWLDANGNTPDFANVCSDISLYPSFSAVKKEYYTWWLVNGEKTDLNPGTHPLPDSVKEHYYDFTEWEKTVDEQTYDVTYVPIFSTPLAFNDDGLASVRIENGNYRVTPPTALNKLNIGNLLKRAEMSGGNITIEFKNGEMLEIKNSDVRSLIDSGACTVSLSAARNTYEISLLDENSIPVDSSVKLAVSVPCDLGDSAGFYLYYKEDGDKQIVAYTLKNGMITFREKAGKYYARIEYLVSSVDFGMVSVSISTPLASEGETVGIILDVNPGIRIDKVYIASDGEEKVEIEGMNTDGTQLAVSGSFVMPGRDVTVLVEYMVLNYVVKFESDGKVIASYIHNYGDTVSVPTDPRKANDDKFSYEFTGWSPSVSEVTESIVYKANYKATPLPTQAEDNMSLSPIVLKALLLIYTALGMLLLVVIPSMIMIFVMVKRRKKCFVKPKKVKK